MADEKDVDYHDLEAYESEEEELGEQAGDKQQVEVKKDGDSYVTIHSSGFREFLLKPELMRAIADCGFEHPSEGTMNILST